MKKRILSLLLAFSMAATLAPATALVGGDTAKAAVVSTVEVSGPGAVTDEVTAPTTEGKVYIAKGKTANVTFDPDGDGGQKWVAGLESNNEDVVTSDIGGDEDDDTNIVVDLIGKEIGSTTVNFVAAKGTNISAKDLAPANTGGLDAYDVVVEDKPIISYKRVASSNIPSGGDGTTALKAWVLVPGESYTFDFEDVVKSDDGSIVGNEEVVYKSTKDGDITLSGNSSAALGVGVSRTATEAQKARFTVSVAAGAKGSVKLNAWTSGLKLKADEVEIFFEGAADPVAGTTVLTTPGVTVDASSSVPKETYKVATAPTSGIRYSLSGAQRIIRGQKNQYIGIVEPVTADNTTGFTAIGAVTDANSKSSVYGVLGGYPAGVTVTRKAPQLRTVSASEKYYITPFEIYVDPNVYKESSVLLKFGVRSTVGVELNVGIVDAADEISFVPNAGLSGGTLNAGLSSGNQSVIDVASDTVTFLLRHNEETTEEMITTYSFETAGRVLPSVSISVDPRTEDVGQTDKVTVSGLDKCDGSRYIIKFTSKSKSGKLTSEYYVVLRIDAEGYRVTFDLNGGKVINATGYTKINDSTLRTVQKAAVNFTFPTDTNVVKAGKQLVGWKGMNFNTQNKNHDFLEGATHIATESTTYVAIWEDADVNITYHNNNTTITPDPGADSTTGIRAAYGTHLRANTFSVFGYEISGWTTVVGGNYKRYEDKAAVNKDMWESAHFFGTTGWDAAARTLYAVWKPATITFSFDGNRAGNSAAEGNIEMEPVKKSYTSRFAVGEFPTSTLRTKYKHFIGWTTVEGGTTPMIDLDDIADYQANSVTVAKVLADLGITSGTEAKLYAVWANGYNIRLHTSPDKNSPIWKTYSAPIMGGSTSYVILAGSGPVLDDTDVVNGRYVIAWHSADGARTMAVGADGSIRYYGSQVDSQTDLYPESNDSTLIQYNVIYNLNSGTTTSSGMKNTVNVKNDENIVLPTVTRTGYTFNGWFLDKDNSNTYSAQRGDLAIDAKDTSVPLEKTAINYAIKSGDSKFTIYLVARWKPNAVQAVVGNAQTPVGSPLTRGTSDTIYSVAYATPKKTVEEYLTGVITLTPDTNVAAADFGGRGLATPLRVTWASDYDATKSGTYTFTGTVYPKSGIGNQDTYTVRVVVSVDTAKAVNRDKINVIGFEQPATIHVPSGTNMIEIMDLIEEALSGVTLLGDEGRTYPKDNESVLLTLGAAGGTNVYGGSNNLTQATATSIRRAFDQDYDADGAFDPTNVAVADRTVATSCPADGVYIIRSVDINNSNGATPTNGLGGSNIINEGAPAGTTAEFFFPVGSFIYLGVVVGDVEDTTGGEKVTSVASPGTIEVMEGTLYSAVINQFPTQVAISTDKGTVTGTVRWDFAPLDDYTADTKAGYTKTITGTVRNDFVDWGTVSKEITATVVVKGYAEKVASTLAEAQKLLDQKYLLRFFNKVTGEHLYTTDITEYVSLVTNKNWVHETYVSGNNTFKGSVERTSVYDTLVFRLFSAANREHMYTTDLNEVTVLQNKGWKLDTTRFYVSQDKTGTPYYRQVRNILINGKPALQHHLCVKEEFDANIASGKGWRADNEGKPFWYSPAN